MSWMKVMLVYSVRKCNNLVIITNDRIFTDQKKSHPCSHRKKEHKTGLQALISHINYSHLHVTFIPWRLFHYKICVLIISFSICLWALCLVTLNLSTVHIYVPLSCISLEFFLISFHSCTKRIVAVLWNKTSKAEWTDERHHYLWKLEMASKTQNKQNYLILRNEVESSERHEVSDES